MERAITMTMELWNEAWTQEDAANERIHELEFYVEDLEMDNAILHENVHMMYAQLHPHGDGEVTDEEIIVDPGEVENEEEKEDPEELVYFSDEDEVESDMDTDADD